MHELCTNFAATKKPASEVPVVGLFFKFGCPGPVQLTANYMHAYYEVVVLVIVHGLTIRQSKTLSFGFL